MIKNIEFGIIFKNEVEVNCMFKRLTNTIQLFIRPSIKIIRINIINERTYFCNVYKIVLINIAFLIYHWYEFYQHKR